MWKTNSYLTILLFLLSALFIRINASERIDSSGKYKYSYFENDPLKTRFYTLKNGFKVIISVNKQIPRFYSCIAVKAGSKNDPKESTGLAHYLEHMLFKGTDKYGTTNFKKESEVLKLIEDLYDQYNIATDPVERKKIYRRIDSLSNYASKFAIANEYDKMMKHLGAKETNAFTSFDQTVYINDLPSNQLENWLKIEGERFRNPILRLFHTELEAVYEEKNISLDSDNNKVFDSLMAALFRNHPYGTQTTLGSAEHLKNPSLKNIKDFYKKYYIPDNMALIVAGNVDPEKVVLFADEYFGHYQKKEVPQFDFKEEPPMAKPSFININGIDNESVTIAYRLPRAYDQEYSKIYLTEKILSDETAGIVQLNLINKQKILSGYSSIYMLKDYSILLLNGVPKKGQTLDQVKELLLQQIDSLKKGVYSNDMLKAIVFNKQTSDLRALKSNHSRAYKILESYINDQNWEESIAQNSELEKIQKKDLMLFAEKYLLNNYVVIFKNQENNPIVNKIEKPEITPVELNRDANSYFAMSIIKSETKEIEPKFISYEKDIDKKELKNGMVILSNRDKESKLFHISYVYEIGRLQDLKLPLAANLIKLLGTDKRSVSEIAMEFYRMACNFSINVDEEQLIISLSGPDERMERAIAILEHILNNAIPDQDILNNLVNDIIKERENNTKDKNALKLALNTYAVYGNDNPVKWQLSNKDLKKLKANELVSLIRELKNYPHQILYYGPMNENNFAIMIKKYHETPEQFKKIPAAKHFEPLINEENKVYFTDFDMVQAEIGWVRNTGVYNPTNQSKFSLFNLYFGSDMSSIVFQTIRESKALAYSCYGYIKNPLKAGRNRIFYGYIGTQADKADSAMIAMKDLLDNLPESKQLFESTKSSLTSSIESEWIYDQDILFNYIKMKRLGLDYDIRKHIYGSLKGISFSDLEKFHEENFKKKYFSIYVIGSKKKIPKKILKKYGRLEYLSAQKILGY